MSENPESSACGGKIRYMTATAALRALKASARTNSGNPKRRRALERYRCGYCGHWHLGTSRDQQFKKRRLREQPVAEGEENE